uniref:DUF927 domain-containing protein n=1 Tax=Candidatus Kentrum sp. SD TaxID=2126332 RepID=A0A450YLG2_9GAMM|nr:MAG: hypothetical protein BECKSD772F_GA0070984_11216 [Candidatus Kentron sp. SD]VFK48901.1 MAG: hypothetical protein BECKSD772E_GA0070983_11486 [Candidatus Kentron sp. SD]VFK80415.1 MAG: hypothetical protein BECKSD772D_GA0070982_11126 [Candidatus Kentron sp. SD]
MPSINDNDFKDNELSEKLQEFLGPRLEEIDKGIYDLVSSAKGGNLEVTNLEDILNLDLPEKQNDCNFVIDLQKTAKELLRDKEKYTFLEKSNDEVLDYLDEYCNQHRLQLCAEKVFLYKELGYDVEADDLEAELRELALGKRVKKGTLNKIFKSYDEKKEKSKSKEKADSGEIPEFEVYGYDERRTVWLGHNGNIEELPATSLKKELPIIFGGEVEVEDLLIDVQNKASDRGRISRRRILRQGVHLINDLWIVISGQRAISIHKDTFEITEISDPIFGKYFIIKENEDWIDLDKVVPKAPDQSLSSLKLKECLNEVSKVVAKWEWRNKEVIPYVSAFFMLTLFQQAMNWRPLLYLSGERATGKTTFSRFFEGTFSGLFEKIDKTTAHAIKQTFGDNSKAGILDEFEHYKSEKQQKDILNLLKTTCGGGKVSFGTTGKYARECYLHHLFWIASISFPKCIETDSAIQDRLIIFPLKKKEFKYVSLPNKGELEALGIQIINTMLSHWNDIQNRVNIFLEEEKMVDQCKSSKVGARQIENFLWASSLISLANNEKVDNLQVVPTWAIKAQEDDGDRILEEILSTRVKHFDGSLHGEAIIFDLIQDSLFEFSESNPKSLDLEIRDALQSRANYAIHTLRNNYITLAQIGDFKEIHMAIQANKLGSFFERQEAFAGIDIKTILSRIESIKNHRVRFGSNSLKSILIPMKKIKETFGMNSDEGDDKPNASKIEPIQQSEEMPF